MYHYQPCANGINALEKLGIKPHVEEDLKMEFCDHLALYSDLFKLQNRYAFQGTFNFGTKMPVLYVDGKDMGTLDNLNISQLRALAQPSPFGKGNKTVYDENVRKALEIKGNRIELDLAFPLEIQEMAPVGYKLNAKLYKLAIYEKDGFFAEHADTLHGQNHLGTLVICLPVPHEGGALVLSDHENEMELPFDKFIEDKQIPWVAFYTDVKHKVNVVKQGMRITLQYDLIAEKVEFENDKQQKEKKLKGEDYYEFCIEKYGYYLESPEKYHFRDYNHENFVSIRNKIHELFSKSNSQSQTNEISQNSNVDGVALMLKRRYGAITLSLDRLKGCDSALYYALKYDFKIELKRVVLEKHVNEDCEEIQVVAFSHVSDKQEFCSSDEESVATTDTDKHKMKVVSYDEKNSAQENIHKTVKKVLFVSGFPEKSLAKIFEQEYLECTGNEPQEGIYSYLHAALFVYPKKKTN